MVQVKENLIEKYEGTFEQDSLGVTLIPTDSINTLAEQSMTMLALFTYLSARPKNWKINAKQLSKVFGCGKDKIYQAIDGLIKLGFLSRSIDRKNGKFAQYHYCLHLRQSQKKSPFPEKPDTVKPDTENPDTYKTYNLKNKEGMCGGEKNHTQRMNKKNTKAKLEAKALACEEINKIFKDKFTGRDVTLQEIFDQAKEYFKDRGGWVGPARLKKWLKMERPDNYPLLVDNGEGKDCQSRKTHRLQVEYNNYIGGVKKGLAMGYLSKDTQIISFREWVDSQSA